MAQGKAKLDDEIDSAADAEIEACLKLDAPKSFFLFAGAGSGRTASLGQALERLRRDSVGHLRLRGQRIGVITYTNAACDEIKERLHHDPYILVSTIHSFVWSLIGGLNSDIREWLRANISLEIAELIEKQAKGRGGKAASDRARSIDAKRERLTQLDSIKCFTYNPNGENRDKDSLNHSEVIKIGAAFIKTKPTMQKILVNQFPFLLIDESQDTNGLLMDAIFEVQAKWKDMFCVGLFGDMMQRIYADGKPNLGRDLPSDWATPAKKMNHRSPRRIIKLINRIRAVVDKQEQQPRSDCGEGTLRLFVLPSITGDKRSAEYEVAKLMSVQTGDAEWVDGSVKRLILEHHMAATRMGFFSMFEPLYKSDTLKLGLLDGTLPGLRLFQNSCCRLLCRRRLATSLR